MDRYTRVLNWSAQCYPFLVKLWVGAKFGTCTAVSYNGILDEAKLCAFTLECTHFVFDKCPIDTHDGASAKFCINSQETDNSAGVI
jgi:hypothetical protein